MASGAPVLTSSASAMPEIAGDAALLVEPTSTQEIAAAMTQLANDENLRNILIAKGHQRAKAFDGHISAQKFWALVGRVADQDNSLP